MDPNEGKLPSLPALPTLSTSSLPSSTATYQEQQKKLGDVASDEATASFIRRVLCPSSALTNLSGSQEPSAIEDLLPPLTSSNEVDLQLYAFISILIKEFVYTWYSRISPDQDFVSEVVQTIAHCTRALEERARTVDFESLIFDDLADLLDAHVNAYILSRRAALAAEPSSNARLVYHTLRRHPALTPATHRSSAESVVIEDPELYSSYRQVLAQALLAVLLPSEDLQNPCLRALVSEVSADLIIGNFVGRILCESTFIYESICKASNVAQRRFDIMPWAFDRLQQSQNRSTRFGIAITSRPKTEADQEANSLSLLMETALQWISLVANLVQRILKMLASSTSLPSRKAEPPATISQTNTEANTPLVSPSSENSPHSFKVESPHQPILKPFLSYRAWRAASHITSFSSKMPWLSAFLSLVQYLLLFGPFELGAANSRLDRLIAHHVVSPVLPLSRHLPTILLNLRIALFPGNTLAPLSTRAQVPSAQNAAETKRAAAFAILNLIPEAIAKTYFATPSAPSLASSSEHDSVPNTPPDQALQPQEAEIELMVRGVEKILDVFSDDYMNRHFAFAVLERVLIALVPELAGSKTVDELLADRGIEVAIGGDLDAAVLEQT